MTSIEIDRVSSVIKGIADEYGIGKVYVFGSHARDEQVANSDIDLLIELTKPLGFKRGRLCLDLEAELGIPVDIVFGIEQLYPPVRLEFEREAVLVFER